MLKMTKIQLQKISDPDMHIFIEEGMRGGICYAAKRYSEASNDLNKPKIQIKYHDTNNLYGKAVMEYLLIKENSLHGYFLEVDIYCPDELHVEQNESSKRNVIRTNKRIK